MSQTFLFFLFFIIKQDCIPYSTHPFPIPLSLTLLFCFRPYSRLSPFLLRWRGKVRCSGYIRCTSNQGLWEFSVVSIYYGPLLYKKKKTFLMLWWPSSYLMLCCYCWFAVLYQRSMFFCLHQINGKRRCDNPWIAGKTREIIVSSCVCLHKLPLTTPLPLLTWFQGARRHS